MLILGGPAGTLVKVEKLCFSLFPMARGLPEWADIACALAKFLKTEAILFLN
jgi:hypothetical protein